MDYSEAALAQAHALAAAPGIDDPTLVDRRALPFCTIDEPASKDLDQAVFVEATEDSGHRVWYAIADADYFVQPGSPLWREAMERGASDYMPGLVVPMLPRVVPYFSLLSSTARGRYERIGSSVRGCTRVRSSVIRGCRLGTTSKGRRNVTPRFSAA